MSWTKPTADGLTATLSAAEVTAFGRSAGFEDAANVILSQTAATVRGFVRAGGVRGRYRHEEKKGKQAQDNSSHVFSPSGSE